jgi:spermidine/putrescine ABC transporter ATP-binding subunit
MDAVSDRISSTGAPVEMRAIVKRFGAHAALDGFDLAIEAGEFITLLGPSGSGKTTALMLIAGFERPNAGEILIEGRAVHKLPAYRRNIGVVFQSYALFPHLTVAENIAFPLKQRGVGRAERDAAVRRMLDLVQLEDFGGRFPQALSGGQQQRVAIARAIVFQPRVLLMDEPLSALDKQLRESLQLEIKGLHERLGITFVYVTHDQREALVMSDRVSVMNRGRIEQIATPRTIYDAPANRFVATFVGEANMLKVTGVRPELGWLSVRLEDGEAFAPVQAHAADCVCMVRPERMRVAASGQLQPGENQLAAVVQDVVFMGEMSRYALRTESGASVIVKQVHRAGGGVIAPGEKAWVVWGVEDTRLVS